MSNHVIKMIKNLSDSNIRRVFFLADKRRQPYRNPRKADTCKVVDSYTLPLEKGQLTITDLAGRIFYNTFVFGKNGMQQINLSDLSNGIYYWKITDVSKNIKTGRITILK